MYKVLLIDDSKTILQLLNLHIEEECPNVTTLDALTFEESSKIINKYTNEIDLAVVDLNMPQSTYGQAAKLALFYNIPTVVLAATSYEKFYGSIPKSHLAHFIDKSTPDSMTKVTSYINRLLKNKETSVLVLKNDLDHQKTLIQDLKSIHFNVLHASNEQEALNILQTQSISTVFIDYKFSDTNGIDFMKKVRESVSNEDIYIIATSDENHRHMFIEFMNNGANNFLHQNYTLTELNIRMSRL